MKRMLLLSTLFFTLVSFSVSGSAKDSFKVYGACGMCKARIEKAATIDGVTSAEWSQQTQMLTIVYDADRVSLDHVHKKIAASGHDTDKVRAEDDVYKALPACCRYERAPLDQAGQAVGSAGSCCSR